MAQQNDVKVEKVNDSSIAALVADAAVTNRQIKELSAKLEAQKVRIRDFAVKKATKAGADRLEIESPEGVATITFPKDKVIIRQGAVPMALKELIPEPVWNGLFRVVAEINGPDAEAVWKQLKGPQRKAVDAVLELKPSVPGVILPK